MKTSEGYSVARSAARATPERQGCQGSGYHSRAEDIPTLPTAPQLQVVLNLTIHGRSRSLFHLAAKGRPWGTLARTGHQKIERMTGIPMVSA